MPELRMSLPQTSCMSWRLATDRAGYVRWSRLKSPEIGPNDWRCYPVQTPCLLATVINPFPNGLRSARMAKRTMVRTRDFAVGASPVIDLIPEYTRKGFFALQQDGQLSAFYTTVKGAIYRESVFDNLLPQQIVISPRADRLVTLNGNDWQVYHVKNPHPEIGFASLWQKIWYEGYPEPDYVWQSTSASDEFEPKLSLVPLVFGTLKAALYGLMFAVPVALAGAIYTAYFMSSRMRGIVKPTIELMEALPTVILGFLAGDLAGTDCRISPGWHDIAGCYVPARYAAGGDCLVFAPRATGAAGSQVVSMFSC